MTEVLYFDRDVNSYQNNKVAIDGVSVADGRYEIEGSKESIIVEKSKIINGSFITMFEFSTSCI